ncbi:MAG: hypothetical protein WDN24_02580 [Sphingomonas sp.]
MAVDQQFPGRRLSAHRRRSRCGRARCSIGLGAGGAVSVAEHDRLAYPHSQMLQAAVTQGYALARRRFAAGDGEILIARRIAPVTPNVALIGQNRGSATSAR